MEHIDPSTVRITVHKHHESEYIQLLGVEPDDRDDLANKEFVDLTYYSWDRPACCDFHREGIPFLGFHDYGESYEPHRMCGDGSKSIEIPSNRDERLLILADELTGLPELQSRNLVHDFLVFEQECRIRMKAAGNVAIV